MLPYIFAFPSVDDIQSGSIPWISSLAFFAESTSLKRTGQGTLIPPNARLLRHVVADISSNGDQQLACPLRHHPPERSISILDALSYTSAFWAAPLLASPKIPFTLFRNLLLRANHSTFEPGANGSVFMLDGGVVDTTGVIGLLQKQSQNIIAFYNNNAPLSEVLSPIAYLFGIEASTDSMNSLLGPSLSRVFPSGLYADTIANLTNPKIGMAHLREVNVLSNQIMGVEPHVIKNLVIFSNAKNDNFILEDPRIMSQLSSSWPDRHLFSPPQLDANVLCIFNDWKVRNYRKVLDLVFG